MQIGLLPRSRSMVLCACLPSWAPVVVICQKVKDIIEEKDATLLITAVSTRKSAVVGAVLDIVESKLEDDEVNGGEAVHGPLEKYDTLGIGARNMSRLRIP